MKTILFYSTLLGLLIASLTVLAVTTAMRPYEAAAPAPARSRAVPAPVAPAS
jgi:hypothetical protein